MGTWTTDTAGMNLAKKEPTPQEKHRAYLFSKRWIEWKPFLEYELRKQGKATFAEIERLRQIHVKACARLLDLHIPFDFVTDKGLRIDDPRISDEQREDEISRLDWAKKKRSIAHPTPQHLRRNSGKDVAKHPRSLSFEQFITERCKD
jgi:hypothetical protein